MTQNEWRDGPDQLYVVGPVWHIVEGRTASASYLGPIYLFKCYRWMSASDAEGRGLFRGEPPPSEPVCDNCLHYRVGAEPTEASEGTGDYGADVPMARGSG